jgi:hypothetical protein
MNKYLLAGHQSTTMLTEFLTVQSQFIEAGGRSELSHLHYGKNDRTTSVKSTKLKRSGFSVTCPRPDVSWRLLAPRT